MAHSHACRTLPLSPPHQPHSVSFHFSQINSFHLLSTFLHFLLFLLPLAKMAGSNYAFCLGFVLLLFFAIGNIIAAFTLRDQQQQRIGGEQWLRPVSVYSSDPSTVILGKHQIKRMAEIGKRERIIMDALGGNDFLIKRSSADERE